MTGLLPLYSSFALRRPQGGELATLLSPLSRLGSSRLLVASLPGEGVFAVVGESVVDVRTEHAHDLHVGHLLDEVVDTTDPDISCSSRIHGPADDQLDLVVLRTKHVGHDALDALNSLCIALTAQELHEGRRDLGVEPYVDSVGVAEAAGVTSMLQKQRRTLT